MNQANTTIDHLIAEKTSKHLETLAWHDSLDVQNAVKKTYDVAFRAGYDLANVEQSQETAEQTEVTTACGKVIRGDKVITSKKPKSKRKKK